MLRALIAAFDRSRPALVAGRRPMASTSGIHYPAARSPSAPTPDRPTALRRPSRPRSSARLDHRSVSPRVWHLPMPMTGVASRSPDVEPVECDGFDPADQPRQRV
jgi:hypothetical protein